MKRLFFRRPTQEQQVATGRTGSSATATRGLLHNYLHRYFALVLFVLLACGALLYTAGAARNPPGCYIDESSISYNAYTISQTGRDEFDNRWPLFFRAFGDYKNPVHVYLLATLYKLTGPGIIAARLLSVAFILCAAWLLGLLAHRISQREDVALFVTASALITPWFFELGRVVLEVSLYPLMLALFLLCVERASLKERWSPFDATKLAATLALLTYTYSIGRLLAPLLAFGLIIFATRARRAGLLLAWFLYALALLPMLVFAKLHPGALTGRFSIITYLSTQSSYTETAREFVRHYFGNLNVWRLLVSGDPNTDQLTHVSGTPHLLFATFLLAAAGAWLVLRRQRDDAWWRFIFYGLAASVVPASLTNEYTHMLRLIALPVFLFVLAVPAVKWLCEGAEQQQQARRAAVIIARAALVSLIALTLLQGALFQWQYQQAARSTWRRHLFDADYPRVILATALARPERPIYIADALAIPGYIQAYWRATLEGVPLQTFARLRADESPPPGALVITTEENCPRCQILSATPPYTLYLAGGAPRPRVPLRDESFRAAITVNSAPNVWHAGAREDLRVIVTNLSEETWQARERSGGEFQVSLGNHWLDADERAEIIHDDGRAALLADLMPGDSVELKLPVNTPRTPGDYVLELDMLQEGVSWFSLKGSRTARLRVRVE